MRRRRLAGLEAEVETIYGSLGELKKQVDVIHGGWALLIKSNVDITQKLDSMANSFAKLENLICAEKANRKTITNSYNPVDQVRLSPMTENVGSPHLGYQRISDSLETRSDLLRKVELPRFNDVYPNIWINRAERFFQLGRYNYQDKFDLLAVAFEGAVLNWFMIELDTDPFPDWDSFKQRLVMRFTSRMEDDPAKRLFSIQQKGSIVAYINEFEELRALVKGIDEANLTHVFFNGLKPEMKEVIKMKKPQGL